MSDEEATLVVTAGTAMYGLDVMGGLIAGQTVVVMGPGPIGLMGVGVAKALGAQPVILTGTRDNRLEIGKKLGANHVINVRNEDAIRKTIASPEFAKASESLSVAPAFLPAAEFGKLMAKEDADLAQIIQALGLKKSTN